MPYKNKDEQRRWQREWRQKRRQEWLIQNGPCIKCGSDQYLEVDHINSNTKVSHNVWSWSEERRNEELAKCQVLCKECHKKKSISELWKPITHGTDSAYTKRKCRCDICKTAHSNKRKLDRKLYNC